MSGIDVTSPSGPNESASPANLPNSVPSEGSRGERLADRVLRGPLVWLLAGLALVQLGTWIPHYLTWPYWADQDVHATLARSWDRGLLPYRDMRCNNFPGSIYLFWALGKIGGWGRTIPFYAFDAGLVVSLGVALVVWSQRKLGSWLPALVGYLTFLSYYLSLDYPVTGQKDWHGSFLAALGLLIAELWPGRAGRTVSALAFALAMAIRPQIVCFLPAIPLALDESTRAAGESFTKTLRACIEWGLTFAILVVLAFTPLLLAGVFPDFLEGIRLVRYGGRYNTVTLRSAFASWIAQIAPTRILLIPFAYLLLGRLSERGFQRTALTWLAALAGVSVYKPMSPFPHLYLDIPMMLIWSVNVAVLTGLVMTSRPLVPSVRLSAVLMLLALGVTIRPLFCVVTKAVQAPAVISAGEIPKAIPSGYRTGAVPTAAFYPWEDYRDVLNYLRKETTPKTQVANVLRGDPAITSVVDRPSAFPAEGITWLRMVNADDEPRFAKSLRESGDDSVVVWVPGEVGPHPVLPLDHIKSVIREQYHPEARFGAIEVWRRTPSKSLQANVKAEQIRSPRHPG